MKRIAMVTIICGIQVLAGNAQPLGAGAQGPVARFAFNDSIEGTGASIQTASVAGTTFTAGLAGSALSMTPGNAPSLLALESAGLPLDPNEDFSVQYWVRTTADSDRRFVLLSHKEFVDNSLASQKQPGWVFYVSDGTWAWSIGSGNRRLSYERDNGERMPVNDGRWHQLTMTYDSALSQVRLFYDGHNKVVYNVQDGVGFDFTNDNPLTVGWPGAEASPSVDIVPAIYAGAESLQALVDAFNALGVSEVEPDEFVHLITDPRRLFQRKVQETAASLGADGAAFAASMESADFEPVSTIESRLMDSPYTIHQVVNFMDTAPAMRIFSLADGRVTINEDAARWFTERERLYPPDFDMDDLTVWDRALSADEVLDAYAVHFKPVAADLEENITSITAGVWNIWHGGKHFTVEEHGWDSRRAIAEILRRQNIDVVMMQETYSSGDFIAAELGYYFATTVDWDYLNQGANISVISRYPIKELHVEGDSPFMNVGARLAISETQDVWAMANWYGMQQFPAVFEFHESRFAQADNVPVLFAGDFNAVPHTDGGDSPASPVMLGAGFTDAFRDTYPSVEDYPGPTHRNGRRIDQLYYKGAGLRNTSTRLVTSWPVGFPSDHMLIRATFDLDYTSRQ